MKKLYTFFIAITVAAIFVPVFTRATGADARLPVAVPTNAPRVYDVTTFGAKGDGQTLDTPAINKAIETAAAAGGGTVHFPAGTYLSVSIRLKSNITLYLDQGATILAADPIAGRSATTCQSQMSGTCTRTSAIATGRIV